MKTHFFKILSRGLIWTLIGIAGLFLMYYSARSCTSRAHDTDPADGFTAAEKAVIQAPAPAGRNDYEGKILRLWKIDRHPDSLLLRAVSQPVTKEMLATDEFRRLNERMLVTVKDSLDEGVGLAAPLIGISRQLFVVQRFDKPGEPFETYLNPVLLEKSDSLIQGVEGCLSVPILWGNVSRSQEITLSYRNLNFEEVTETIKGFTAVIFQHEYDHLQGQLYIDKMDSLYIPKEND